MNPLLERPMPLKCGSCRQKEVTRVSLPYSTDIEYEGRTYTVTIPDLEVLRCGNCGNTLLEAEANKRITEAFRREVGLLRPDEIRHHREELKLTQRELAEHLRVAEATLSRWETGGQIQQRGYDRLLRQAFGLENIRMAIATRSGARNGAHARRVIARLVESIESPEVREAVEQALADRPRLAEDLESGKADWERLLRHLLPWVLALSPPEQRGWIQFFKKDLGSDDERPLTTLLEIRNKADGDFAADLTQYIRQLVDLSRGKRKDAMRISKDFVEALSKG